MLQWVTPGGQQARSRGPGATAFRKGLRPAPWHEVGRREGGADAHRDVTSSEHGSAETQRGAGLGLLGTAGLPPTARQG